MNNPDAAAMEEDSQFAAVPDAVDILLQQADEAINNNKQTNEKFSTFLNTVLLQLVSLQDKIDEIEETSNATKADYDQQIEAEIAHKEQLQQKLTDLKAQHEAQQQVSRTAHSQELRNRIAEFENKINASNARIETLEQEKLNHADYSNKLMERLTQTINQLTKSSELTNTNQETLDRFLKNPFVFNLKVRKWFVKFVKTYLYPITSLSSPFSVPDEETPGNPIMIDKPDKITLQTVDSFFRLFFGKLQVTDAAMLGIMYRELLNLVLQSNLINIDDVELPKDVNDAILHINEFAIEHGSGHEHPPEIIMDFSVTFNQLLMVLNEYMTNTVANINRKRQRFKVTVQPEVNSNASSASAAHENDTQPSEMFTDDTVVDNIKSYVKYIYETLFDNQWILEQYINMGITEPIEILQALLAHISPRNLSTELAKTYIKENIDFFNKFHLKVPNYKLKNPPELPSHIKETNSYLELMRSIDKINQTRRSTSISFSMIKYVLQNLNIFVEQNIISKENTSIKRNRRNDDVEKEDAAVSGGGGGSSQTKRTKHTYRRHHLTHKQKRRRQHMYSKTHKPQKHSTRGKMHKPRVLRSNRCTCRRKHW